MKYLLPVFFFICAISNAFCQINVLIDEPNDSVSIYETYISENLPNAILELKLDQKIEEFEKADIRVKTIRLKKTICQKKIFHFLHLDTKTLLKRIGKIQILESKFFFVFYQFEKEGLVLRKVKFWNMPHSDIIEAKTVWEEMVKTVSIGEIIKEVTAKGVRKTYFPKKIENRISHVRPHAKNAADTYKLPVSDKLTGLTDFTKYCFWLNARYVNDEIYLK